MMARLSNKALVLLAAGVLCVLMAPSAWAESNWTDEVWNAVTLYKAAYPSSNFEPYYQQLSTVRSAMDRGEQRLVRSETGHFLKMLQNREHGINDVAADELYNIAVAAIPTETPASIDAIGAGDRIELGGQMYERLMSVPDHPSQTPFDGGPPCPKGGCDYWEQDVYDPGAAG